MNKNLISFGTILRTTMSQSKTVKTVFSLLLLLSLGVGNAWADLSTLTFTAKCNGSGTADDGAEWTVTSDGSESTYDSTKGIHYGTSSGQVQYITLSTSDISGTITKVVVNASTASGVSATVSVTVGGNAFGGSAQSLTTSAANYTFEGSAAGEIVVTITKPSRAAKAIYCKSIAVTYSSGGSSPSITSTTSSMSFSAESGSTDSKSFTFSAANLTANVGLALSGDNSGLFSLSETSVSKGSGTITDKSITVTYSPTAAGTHSATLTLTSGTASKAITLSGTATAPAAKYTVSFNAGAGSPTPSSLEEPTAGAGITLPSGPTPTCSADGWSFAGWAAANVASSTTTAPTLYSAGDNYKPADDCTLYAVYSKTTGGGGSGATAGTTMWSENWTGVENNKTPTSPSASGSSVYGSATITYAWTNGGSTSQTYTSGGPNSNENILVSKSNGAFTANGIPTGGATELTVTYATSGSGSIAVTSSTADVSVSGSTITISDASVTYFSLEFKNASGSNVRLDDILVVVTTAGSTGTTNYWSSPTCAGCANSITITKGDDPANGTFTLSNVGTVCIDDGNASTTVTASPSTHYHLASVTTTGSVGTVGTISGNTCTITGINANTTVNVTFAADTKEVVTWHVATATTDEEKYSGETLEGITAPTSSDCDGEKVFVGWTADGTYSDENDAPADLFTDPTTKTMPVGGTDYYAVFASETSSKTAGTVISTGDNGKSAVGALDDVTTSGLGSDYTSHSPYLLRFDDTGDYIQFDLDYPPTGFSFDYKMIGGNKTSTMTIKECATVDGTYTDVQAFTISGAQNSTGSFTTTATFTKKYIRMVFTKGSNVGVGNITITGYTGTTSQSDYAVSCVTYTVTATSNNDSYGTVSVNRYTITATPATGYVADGYNLSSGTATVTQTGNTYKVHPTSDCSIQINFRAAATYTVTLYDNGGSYTETAYEATPYMLPEEGLSSCPDATFLGWVTGSYTDHGTGTSTQPTYQAGGTEVNIAAAASYTAVYSVATPTNIYNILSDANNLSSGKDYLIAAYASSDYPLKATMTDGYVDASKMTLGESDNTITDETLVWTITKTTTNKCQIYNKANNVYLGFSASNELVILPTATDVTYAWTDGGSEYSDNWDFKSPTNNSYLLSYYSSTEQYSANTSKDDNIYLYARQYSETYTSHPNCCYAPAEALTIESDVVNITGSGVAHLTLTGGNGQDITWTTTVGSLSDKNNSGATLTMPVAGATTVYTVTATQADDETDPDNVICGATVIVNITVKAQWTISFNTKDEGSLDEYKRITVTDGDTYTMIDLDEYTCTGEASFAGWVDDLEDTSVEAAVNSTQTATADKTWYAAWSTSAAEKEVYLYTKVTDISELTDGCTVLIGNNAGTKALGKQNTNNRSAEDVSQNPANENQIYFEGTDVKELTLGTDGTIYTFYDSEQPGYLYAASSSKNYLKTQATNDENGQWTISISNTDGLATIVAQGSSTNNNLKYNSGSTIFSCYATGQQYPAIYKKSSSKIGISSAGSTITTNNTVCSRGAVIIAESGKWISAANGQKVKITIPIDAKGYDVATSLSVTGVSNSHFKASLPTETVNVPASPGHAETTLTVEYMPVADDLQETATITLADADGIVTKNIIVNGRSLPDEFLMITNKTSWYALPANMNNGASQYEGIVVTPTLEEGVPTMVSIASSTAIYSLKSVASSRYETAGNCVRLVGNNNRVLYSTNTAGQTSICNKETLSDSNDEKSEWTLTTTDGQRYTITNPNHKDDGRQLSFGVKFGMYKSSECIFYLVPAGCTSQPDNVNVSPRRVDATIAWSSNASQVIIEVYTNEAMTEGRLAQTATSSPYTFTGLSELTDYWFKLTPETDESCAVTGAFTTTGPVIDIVGWTEDHAIVFVDKGDVEPQVIIAGEEEHGAGSGATATNLFFSKYFEAESNAKMLAVFNGTNSTISLADVEILQRHSGTGGNTPLSLATFGKTPGYIQPMEEIILYNEDDSNNAAAIMRCATNDPTFPTWNKVNNKNLEFSGKGTIRLFRGGKCIDIIGAMPDGGAAGAIDDMANEPQQGTTKPSWGDKEGFTVATGDNYNTKNVEENNYGLSTNRCLLIRKSHVTSGDSAVLNNYGDFKTLGTYTGVDSKEHKGEWAGLQIATSYAEDGTTKTYENTCAGFQETGKFDYSNYYKEWHIIGDPIELSGTLIDADAKLYSIEIEDLSKYSCLSVLFRLQEIGGDVLTEKSVQVPILINSSITTASPVLNEIVKTDGGDPLYEQSIDRCRTCDVVILGNGTLTKDITGDEHDVPEVGNIKVYPGGQLVIPSGTLKANSLALRREEDDLSTANISGTLDIAAGKNVYLDVYIDPTNWHYISLPYDCDVNDITFSDGTPAALGTDYLLAWFDGAYRAEHKTGGWTYVEPGAILKKGLGYILSLPGTGSVKREIRFPMQNDENLAEDKSDKTIEGLYGYGCDNDELRPNHKGWNLLGNPYLMPYTSDIMEPLAMGTFIPDPDEDPWMGHYIIDPDPSTYLRYIVVPVDNGWSGYYQVPISEYPMKPFTSYFVQVGGTDPELSRYVDFNQSQVTRVMSRSTEVEDNHPVWCGITLTNNNNEKDETGLLISDKFTDGYDMMNDLVKWRGDYYQYYSKPVLASSSRSSKEELAFNALPDNSAKAGVPLNYYAAAQGEYTIALDGRYSLDEVKEVQLYDNDLENWHDLMMEDYQFVAKKGNNTTRFTLYVTVERKQPQAPTGADNIYGDLTLTTSGRTLILSGLQEDADIYVYDPSGKLIVSGAHASNGDSGVWRTTVPAQGVYFVRVMTDNEAQTLNTIVY